MPSVSPGEQRDKVFLNDIFLSKLNKVISLSKDTSQGLDSIRNNHLKVLNVEIRLILLKEYNNILMTGCVPSF